MARCLGADLWYQSPDFATSFDCSTDSSKKVSIILDPCHMLKLVRNCLASVDYLVDGQGSHIKWSYIEALEVMQREEGKHLGNKLTKVHVEWEKQKMKVRRAVKTLSSSVADALDFCEFTLRLPRCQSARATARFKRIFDRLFDLLNLINPLAKSFKAALRNEKAASWKAFLQEAENYITKLTCANRRLVIESLKKTGFAGLLICIRSAANFFDHLVDIGKKKYLLTLKISQDHLEIFFVCIRGFEARKVADCTSCDECVTARQSKELPALTQAKGRGGLVVLSKDVLYI
ncbi:hypothetical protein MRX96_020038 [Rhipicephalus microplus]